MEVATLLQKGPDTVGKRATYFINVCVVQGSIYLIQNKKRSWTKAVGDKAVFCIEIPKY